MGFNRLMVQEGSLQRSARAGDHVSQPVVIVQSADSNQAISVGAIAAGVYARAGMTAGRSDTLPAAAALLASPQFANMDIGDSYRFTISVRVAFALTLVAGTGLTLVGLTVAPASGSKDYLLIRTGAATFDVVGL